jgi:hypothetical protein
MKNCFASFWSLCSCISAGCGSKPQEATAAGFKPALDTKTSCEITVVGSYGQF